MLAYSYLCRQEEMLMDKKILKFNSKPGSFIESLRAYREYKKEWQARMAVKLDKMEEEIKQAKADPLYKMESL